MALCTLSSSNESNSLIVRQNEVSRKFFLLIVNKNEKGISFFQIIHFLVFVAFAAQTLVLDLQSKPQLNLLSFLQHQEVQRRFRLMP